MSNLITGTITTIYPDNVNTDDIIPAWTLQESTDRSFFQKYAFQHYDTDFINRCRKTKSNIIIAGENFGCGSSREQAVYAIQENGVVAVIAKSFPDIFHRNSLNNGLVLIVVEDMRSFKIGDKLSIDLEKRVINITHCHCENPAMAGDARLPSLRSGVSGQVTIPFHMSDHDVKTFSMGGKIGRIRNHLSSILSFPKLPNIPKSPNNSMSPQTMVEKIISDHMGRTISAGEKLDHLPIDVLFFNEVIGPASVKDYITHFSDIYHENGKKVEVFDPKKVFIIPDHTVPSSSVPVSEGVDFLENFSREQNILCYKEGDGIEHVVLAEDGHIIPGSIVLGTDSHTDTNGAFNALAFGIGTTDGAYALATGHLYDFEVPHSVRVNLKGKLKKGVYAKDIILYLIGQLGVDGAVKKVVEFGGAGLKNISMDGRATIANMAVEMGARTAIFEPDNILDQYLENKINLAYHKYTPDKNANYCKTISLDLSTLEPCIAFPHKPGNVTYVSKIKNYMKKSQSSVSADFVPVESIKITDAFLGACTNGRYEDFTEAAKILKGRKIHDNVNFVAIPASRKIYNRLMKDGILQIFAEAGANIESSNCGPCFGKHMGILSRKAQMISSSNRNYIGRMGSKDAKIFLASPVTVAASAVAGEITDPRKYLKSDTNY